MKNERRLRDEFWTDLQRFWLEIPVRGDAWPRPPTWEAFSERFDRSFRQVAFYVGQRVDDRSRFRYVVTEVLAGSLDLFITPCDEAEALSRLKASADRLLAR